MTINTTKITGKHASWSMHFERCNQRGVSPASYTEQENLNGHNLYYWKRAFANKEKYASNAPSAFPGSPFLTSSPH